MAPQFTGRGLAAQLVRGGVGVPALQGSHGWARPAALEEGSDSTAGLILIVLLSPMSHVRSGSDGTKGEPGWPPSTLRTWERKVPLEGRLLTSFCMEA